jgi:hypothetical protein
MAHAERNMRLALFATLLLTVFCAWKAQAADIYYYPPDGCTLTIEGQVEPGDDVAFYEKLVDGLLFNARCNSLVVELSSPGGNVGTAIKIGRQIRAIHGWTHASSEGERHLIVGIVHWRAGVDANIERFDPADADRTDFSACDGEGSNGRGKQSTLAPARSAGVVRRHTPQRVITRPRP